MIKIHNLTAAEHIPLLPPLSCSFAEMLARRVPRQGTRHFSTSLHCASNIGSKPLAVPSTVTITVTPPPPPKRNKYIKPGPFHHPLGGPSATESDAKKISITGPLGILELDAPNFISLVPAWTVNSRLASRIAQIEEQGQVATARNDLAVIVTDDKTRKQRQMWGTIRALLQNCIQGVSTGHQSMLTLKGIGYRGALIDGNKRLELKVGFNHNVYVDIPDGIQVTMTNPTIFEVKCIDKYKLGVFCASVRRIRPPEPYKGKVKWSHIDVVNCRVFLLEMRQSRSKRSRGSNWHVDTQIFIRLLRVECRYSVIGDMFESLQ
jgi:large subunit ribosomal protein L6